MAEVALLRPDRKFHPDPARSYTMPARYYTDPAILEREKAAIFFKSWQYVCHVEELAAVGSYVTAEIFDQHIALVKGKDERIRAFYNVCMHRAHELLKGRGKLGAKTITCPYHAWAYRLDGSLRSARGADKVAGFDAGEFGLRQVQLEVFCNLVFVNLDPDAPALASRAGGLEDEVRRFVPDLDALTFARAFEVPIKANWKNVMDNFLECYHCAVAHPAFAQLIDMATYRTETFDIHSSHRSRCGRPENSAYAFDADDESQVGIFWYLWPNLAFNVFPGESNFATFRITPTGPDSCVERFEFFFKTKEPGPDCVEAMDYVERVLTPEDVSLCENVQLGLHQMGYNQGRFVVDAERSEISEHGVHHFHSLVLNALED